MPLPRPKKVYTEDELYQYAVGALGRRMRSVAELKRLGWGCELEYGFNNFGKGGSVDILAWFPPAGALLLVEVKTRQRTASIPEWQPIAATYRVAR